MPRTTLYLAETAPHPTIFYFSRQKILPRTCPGLGPGHRHPPLVRRHNLRMTKSEFLGDVWLGLNYLNLHKTASGFN